MADRSNEQTQALPPSVSGPGEPAPVETPETLSVLPVREAVVFPGTVTPLGVGRPSSRKLVDESLPTSKVIGLFTQRDPDVESPGPDDLYDVGTAVMVLKLLREPDDTIQLIVHGIGRVRVREVLQTEPYIQARVERLTDQVRWEKKLEAATKNLRETATELLDLSPNDSEQAKTVLMNLEEPGNLADFIGAHLSIETDQKQDILEELDVSKRVRLVQGHVARNIDILKLQQKIQQDVASELSDVQRKAYLREQLKAIQRELGDEDTAGRQVEEIQQRLDAADPPQKVREEAEREMRRLHQVPPASPEYSVILSYLETIADLPWNNLTEDQLDLDRARSILDRDHHDLETVKRRLIEHLAVRKLNPEGRGPILCLVGPPGVGKTSLGQSIADALGRSFGRLSLGGLRDEAEIRGHRRTYIGAMPGRIIQEIRRAGTRNPVLMLDEVDKVGADFRGDPASALLEVLDPRQNHGFDDRYLDVPFDLSQVIFIATANYMDPVHPALRDRMEVIELPGYTDEQKLQIARKYLVPRQLRENGLTRRHCRWQTSGLKKVMHGYTREAGVRELERQIGAVCRSVAAMVAGDGLDQAVSITEEKVVEHLGPEKYVRELKLRKAEPGVVTGLAYTPVGGEVLFIEAARYPGRAEVMLTGQIGEVMKESVHAAYSLVKARAGELGIDPTQLRENDLHVHVPAGAVPKDGPSAGVGMFTAIASLFLDKPVRPDLAMTGEISLRGVVMPVSGLKEKALAAMRVGIRTVVLPKANEKDLPEIPDEAKRKLRLVFVASVDELLDYAFRSRRAARSAKVDRQPA